MGTPKTNEDNSGAVVKKKRSKKKKRLPKNYNPNVDPDPERWLPRRERTGLKYMPGGYRQPRKQALLPSQPQVQDFKKVRQEPTTKRRKAERINFRCFVSLHISSCMIIRGCGIKFLKF